MFFKRLSRSRSNSQSYVDNYPSPHDSKTNSASYDDKDVTADTFAHDSQRPPSSAHQNNPEPSVRDSLDKETGMYARPNAPTEVGAQYQTPGSRTSMSNGFSRPGANYDDGSSPPVKHEAPPDLLMQAFNQALRPYTEKVEALEGEIADLRAYIDQLEAQRSDVHTWIDKRGLRPDVPQSIAHQMDTASHAASPTHAATTLNAQLDRKITIVNFDLHRLQDDLNDSLPTPSFSACMLKFLPDISRLSSLPSGPRYAFHLLLKLGGNLNSHGGLENGDPDDLSERRSFYGRLDDAMVEVVRGRFREEGDGWEVQREIKRIEKTGAYLRNWGVEPYFPHTLAAMRDGLAQTGGGGGGGGATGTSPTYN